MSDFNIEAELAMMVGSSGVRQKKNDPKKEVPKVPPVRKQDPPAQGNASETAKRPVTQGNAGQATKKPLPEKQVPTKRPVPPVEVVTEPIEAPAATPTPPEVGLKVTQSHQESASGDAKPSHSVIDYKRFKELPGIFQRVGGERPVVLNPDINRSSVGGVPTSLMTHIRDTLRTRHVGATVHFPWGQYTVTHDNKVFTQNSTLIRYMAFDALRDDDGLAVQYAKQWFIGHHPLGFEQAFDPISAMRTSDELDIYALLLVASSDEQVTTDESERFDKLDAALSDLTRQVRLAESARASHAEKEDTIQTILLLDRMGLLKGGLPRDIGEFVRVLEVNREMIGGTRDTVDKHARAERIRKQRLAMDAQRRDPNRK